MKESKACTSDKTKLKPTLKELDRMRIAQQTEAYLASGKEIEQKHGIKTVDPKARIDGLKVMGYNKM